MPARAPDALNQAPPTRDAARSVTFVRRQAESLDTAADQADSHQRLSRVQHLSEDVRTQRKSAEVFEHGYEVWTSMPGGGFQGATKSDSSIDCCSPRTEISTPDGTIRVRYSSRATPEGVRHAGFP